MMLQAGRYGGIAFGLALAAAVAGGYGVATAETSDSQSTSSSQESADSTSDGAPSSGATTGTRSGPGSDEDDTDVDDTVVDDADDDDTDVDSDDLVDDDVDDTDDIDTDDADDVDETDGTNEPEDNGSSDNDSDSIVLTDHSRTPNDLPEAPSAEVVAPVNVREPAESDPTPPVVELDIPADAPAAAPVDTVALRYQPSVEAVPMMVAAPLQQPVEVPFLSALLGWIQHTFFNRAPVIHYRPEDNVQGPLGVITGNIGTTDPEGDPLKYRVVQQPAHGTLVIDQATGYFTYTPDLAYAQSGGPDDFVVRVTDGKFNFLHFLRPDFGSPRAKIDVNVASILPSADRFIVPLPDTIVQPQNPAYTADSAALVFRATPVGATRSEIYRVNTDGSALQCLTCGLAPELTVNLSKPFVFDDGNRILLSAGTQSDTGGETADHYILECNGGVNSCGAGSELLKITVPTNVPANVVVIQKQRELRVAPDGQHVGFTQLLGSGTATQLVSSVGRLERTDTGYSIVDAHVVYVGGELKNFTSDGKGVMITDFSGKYEAGNADNILVDLRDGTVTRLTANLDYDESVDMSGNGQWLAVGSSRTLDYLTPMSQVVRPTFVPAYVVFPTFQAKKGSLNQAWVVSREGELARENGVFLGDTTGAYNSVPVANWSPDGTQVAFWERSKTDPTDTRLVIATLNNIDGGTRAEDVSTPDVASWAQPLSAVVVKATPTEPSRAGHAGGNAVVTSVKNGNLTTTTVTYTNFEDEEGFILNGTETTIANATLTNITYSADITVTGSDGTDRGYLKADNVKIVNQLSMTGVIESSVDGNHLVMGTPIP